jgi:hypothetical protein
MKKYAVCLFTLLFLFGCATVPLYRVPQPWTRSLNSSQPIDPKKSAKIEVVGITSPLLGNEQLTSHALQGTLTQLAKRRGFSITTGPYDYLVKLTYRTERRDKMRMSTSVSSSNAQLYGMSTGSGAGATSGLGVSIARAIGVMVSRSSTVAEQRMDEQTSYTHTIAIDIANTEGTVLWKGESTWDTEELDLMDRIVPALQLILSDLPSDKTTRPEIQEVKESHVNNYYRLECNDVWFTCPALPYRIWFEDKNATSLRDFIFPSGIENKNALACYVDLIQTAEYALPNGDEREWIDPLAVSLWRNVTLGGQYLLGPKKMPVNVIIELAGKKDGYFVTSCRIVDPKEFSDFNTKLLHWREALANYYDVFKK